jgi:hypothetical protein
MVPLLTALLLHQPNGDFIRPTTRPGTSTPLRFSPVLRCDVVFSNRLHPEDEEHIKTATLYESKVDLGSCDCTTSQNVLPTYADEASQYQPPVSLEHSSLKPTG